MRWELKWWLNGARPGLQFLFGVALLASLSCCDWQISYLACCYCPNTAANTGPSHTNPSSNSIDQPRTDPQMAASQRASTKAPIDIYPSDKTAKLHGPLCACAPCARAPFCVCVCVCVCACVCVCVCVYSSPQVAKLISNMRTVIRIVISFELPC